MSGQGSLPDSHSTRLYYAETINPRKCCAVARHVGAQLEFVRMDLLAQETRTPEFLKLNPNGKVPVLQDGDLCLWESNAIMCRLSDMTGAELWPHDGRQSDVLRWLFWDAEHFSRHAGRLYFEHIIKPTILGLPQPDRNAVDQSLGFFRTFAAVLDEHLSAHRYVAADTLTVADFAIGITLPYAKDAHIPIAEFKAICRWHDRLSELKAWREPFP
jgi:glutathione S-transferase